MKDKINKKDYLVEKGEVLKGSSLLRKKDSNKNRVSYMLQNMDQNKAYLFAKERNSTDKNMLLKTFQKNYENYRLEWGNQPKTCISKNFLGEQMKKNKKPPLCVDVEVAAICDLACSFCFREYLETPDKIIDEKLCFDLIDQAEDLKVPSMKFNWRGEPLLNPKLPEFIKYAKKRGILETIINTNATNLNKENAKKLVDSGLDMIFIL